VPGGTDAGTPTGRIRPPASDAGAPAPARNRWRCRGRAALTNEITGVRSEAGIWARTGSSAPGTTNAGRPSVGHSSVASSGDGCPAESRFTSCTAGREAGNLSWLARPMVAEATVRKIAVAGRAQIGAAIRILLSVA